MKKIFTCLLIVFLFAVKAHAQLLYQPYSFQFYQKLNVEAYSPSTNIHTALKPYLFSDTSALRPLYDSLLMNNADNKGRSWLHRVFFSGHVIEDKTSEYTFYLDYLPDVQAGREFEDKKNTYLNTRGYQLFGTVGKRFFFYSSGYENQGAFANYEQNYIKTTGIIPGEAYDRSIYGFNTTDWSYVTAMMGYQVSKSFSIELGEDKTFIGDGYRSVLLSDYASNYPLLRVKFNLAKNIQYMAMWAYLEDQSATQFNSFYNNRRKWAALHYIDWNITNRASLGFFNALIAEEANDQGKLHGFDVNYINPVLFVSSLGPSSSGVPDHTLLGLNAKYKVFDKTTVYGQFLYDQATAVANDSKTAWQIGFRGSDLFKINRFNYLFEYNTASPYTYSNQNPIVNYTELDEPLAHPYGSNFREWLSILNYSIGKFDFQGQINYAKYGLNTATYNYGKDLTIANNTDIPPGNASTGQGLATTLKYAEGTVAYLLNPKYNFRVEVGAVLRQEVNIQSDAKTVWLTIGLRSSFRDLYHDF